MIMFYKILCIGQIISYFSGRKKNLTNENKFICFSINITFCLDLILKCNTIKWMGARDFILIVIGRSPQCVHVLLLFWDTWWIATFFDWVGILWTMMPVSKKKNSLLFLSCLNHIWSLASSEDLFPFWLVDFPITFSLAFWISHHFLTTDDKCLSSLGSWLSPVVSGFLIQTVPYFTRPHWPPSSWFDPSLGTQV